MIDYTVGTRLLGEGDGVAQIIIYFIVGAIVVIGNISKARAQQKRTRHTDVPRPKPKPSTQRMQAQISPSKPPVGKGERQHKYYPPGGFAEALLDESLEEKLKNRSKRTRKLTADEQATIQPIESTEVMEHDLESMGHLDTLDPMGSLEEYRQEAIANLISIDGPDDLVRAVVYAEIIGKPVGLRGF